MESERNDRTSGRKRAEGFPQPGVRKGLYEPRDSAGPEKGPEDTKTEARGGEKPDGAAAVADGSGFRLYTMTVIGQVEGHYLLPDNQKVTKYEHMLPALTEIEERPDIDGLLLLLNTVGGDVEAGLAIAEMIAGMTKPTVSLILGGGHSIGMPLAVSAKRSFIVPSATMMIHPVRINGLVIGVPQSFDAMRKMQDRILRFVCSHSRVPEEKLRDLIMKTDEIATDIGSVLSGEEAVGIGLIDEIGGLKDAIAALKAMKGAGAQRPPAAPFFGPT